MKYKVLLWTFAIVSTIVYLIIIPNVMYLFVGTKDASQLRNGDQRFIKGIDTVLDDQVRLNEPSALIDGKHILMYSWNINERNVNYFTNFEGNGYNNDIKLIDSALASSANPNFFSPAKIEDNFYISGDMVLQSPAFYSYELATKMEKESIRIISVGTVKEWHDMPEDNTLKSWSKLLKESNIPIKAAANDYLTNKLMEK